MKHPAKLKPHSLEITFCKHAPIGCERCDSCARNIIRYAIHKRFRVSIFAKRPWKSQSYCEYYLQDARKPEE